MTESQFSPRMKASIQTNEGSAYDATSPDSKRLLLRAVRKRLGPNVNVELAEWSLRAANTNVQWACNIYLRRILEDNSKPTEARNTIRRLFRIDGHQRHLPSSSSSSFSSSSSPSSSMSTSIAAIATTTAPLITVQETTQSQSLSSLPEAVLQIIGLSLDLFSMFSLCSVSKASRSTFDHQHSFWKSYCKVLYPVKRSDHYESGKWPTQPPVSFRFVPDFSLVSSL